MNHKIYPGKVESKFNSVFIKIAERLPLITVWGLKQLDICEAFSRNDPHTRGHDKP